MNKKAGFVAVVGRPNAGKSTLLNWLLGEKISMVSHKANATRKRINAIVMHDQTQIIFIDTPGLHEKERLLNQFMMEEALKAIGDCDLVLFLAPVTDRTIYYEEFLKINSKKRPHLLLLTKMDQLNREESFKAISKYQKFQEEYSDLIPVSVKKGIGEKDIKDTISKYLPESEYLYDTDILTTEYVRDIYREFIREAIFENVSDEIPYSTDVKIDKIEEKPNIDKIRATIVVEKNSQKGIVIGKGGAALKRIGKDSRLKIERFINKKVFLELFVIVRKGWTKDLKELKELGYKWE